MSTLFLSTDLEHLAGTLEAELSSEEAQGRCGFLPATIIVPNRNLQSWLQLFLARKQGLAINLEFKFLESALWDIFKDLAPRENAVTPEILDHERYRLLLVSILLRQPERGDELAPLREYLGATKSSREHNRRVWELADTLARLIRDYEYHRQEELIQKWLKGKDAWPRASQPDIALERCQRALFHSITNETSGLRARLGATTGTPFKTLPQYANEVMTATRPKSEWPSELTGRAIHFFGISQISAYHTHLLSWLGERLDLRLYHLNPLVGRSPESQKSELLSVWGSAAAESLKLLVGMNSANRSTPTFHVSDAAHPELRAQTTVLSRLQRRILGDEAAGSVPQDTSLQIVACPGLLREVETAYNTIIHAMLQDPLLTLNQFTILVTDMTLYQPVIQFVFDRRPVDAIEHGREAPLIPYNLSDFSAAGQSMLGKAIISMLDLAMESFTRTRVFELLLNPCFLTKFNIDRQHALKWLTWTERLGIYHGWDARDKASHGHKESPQFSWKLGMQRLRLGRIMQTPDPRTDEPAPRFGDIIPYADMDSSDGQGLDAFCQAVEGLLPRLCDLRELRSTGQKWAAVIQELVQDFLAVPEDRDAESAVLDTLLSSLPLLATADVSLTTNGATKLELALVREFVAARLESLEARSGQYLSGGVTIASLQPSRPIPFEIVYVLGLGEIVFPTLDVPSKLDLRERERKPGDIKRPEAQRLQFLEAILSARRKLYLSYSCREIQKDQELYPCVPLLQLKRFLETHILPPGSAPFETVQAPLQSHDAVYLTPPRPAPRAGITDIFVNYSETDRLLALRQLVARRAAAGLPCNTQIMAELERAKNAREKLRSATIESPASDSAVSVSVAELCRFLRNPAEASLRRHLKIVGEEFDEPCDDEPFYTECGEAIRLVADTLRRFTVRAATDSVKTAVAEWPARFEQHYNDRQSAALAPDGAFAEVDHRRLRDLLRDRIPGLAEWIDERRADGGDYCGPIQLGPAATVRQPRVYFPAAQLNFAPREISVTGSYDLVWRGETFLDMLVITCNTDAASAERLNVMCFDAVLFYLTLICGTEPNKDGISPQKWLDSRRLRIHIANDDGITAIDYPDIPEENARRYLEMLVTDFLDVRRFERLPFYTIEKNAFLRSAYELDEGDPALPAVRQSYSNVLAAELEKDDDQFERRQTRVRIEDIAAVQAPPDAFDLIRRRFRLLDLGPANRRTGSTR